MKSYSIHAILSRAGIAQLREDHDPFTYVRDEGAWAVSMNGFYTSGELAWALRAVEELNRVYATNPIIASVITRPEFAKIFENGGSLEGGSLANGVTYQAVRGLTGAILAVYSEENCAGVYKGDSHYTNVEDFIANTDYADYFEA